MRVAFGAYRGTMQSGGLGLYLHALTRELVEQGIEVDLYVGPPYPDPMPWARVIELPNEHYWGRKWGEGWVAPVDGGPRTRILEPLNFYEFAATRFGFLPEMFAFSLRMARRFLSEVRQGARYDLIHDVQTLGYGLLWMRALGPAAVSTIHHPLTIDRRFSLARDRDFMDMKGTLTFHPVRTQGRVARRIDGRITSSEASVSELQSGFGVCRERIHNVGNGVELPTPGSVRPAPDKPELLFVGRCGDPNKGFEYLVGALALLPEQITLRVLDDPPLETQLMRQIGDLKLDERITFSGKVPRADLEEAMRTCSALVVPSLFEGFGLPAVEVLAAGTPLVATRAGALAEVVARAGTGTLVAPGDSAALAQGIEHVLANWKREQAAALAARERIEAEFGWPQVTARTVSVYRQVLEERHAAR
jgi:glycosyltransferase involved in cell wall biosynthesis